MGMNEMAVNTLALSCDGHRITWQDQSGELMSHDCESVGLAQWTVLPEIDVDIERIYLPMEWLLSRFVQLPLKSPNMVDADMLFQELAETSDVEADNIWLAWKLNACDAGVAGMVFGLPETVRTGIQSDVHVSTASLILVDGYERLSAWLDANHSCAVLDQDDEGMFVGFYDGHVWRGMRRLNGVMNNGLMDSLLPSLQAMGFVTSNDAILGRADVRIVEKLKDAGMQWQGVTLEAGLSRHQANLALSMKTPPTLNMRHGRWAVRTGWGRWRPWQRSGILAAALLLVWLFGMSLDILKMNGQISDGHARIEAAFHQGLPNEPVMLDALAQLRQAAGGTASQDVTFLRGLQAVSDVYQKQAWVLNSLELRDGTMQMAGEVKNIEILNRIQSHLQQALFKDVKIVDTNITGEKVVFRMAW